MTLQRRKKIDQLRLVFFCLQKSESKTSRECRAASIGVGTSDLDMMYRRIWAWADSRFAYYALRSTKTAVFLVIYESEIRRSSKISSLSPVSRYIRSRYNRYLLCVFRCETKRQHQICSLYPVARCNRSRYIRFLLLMKKCIIFHSVLYLLNLIHSLCWLGSVYDKLLERITFWSVFQWEE